MIFNETLNFLYSSLAGGNDAGATTRLSEYQRTRLKRVLLARSVRPYLLEASWINRSALAGDVQVALTAGVLNPLIVLDGAIRTSNPTFVAARPITLGDQTDLNNFELQITRTGGDSRVQIVQSFIKDEMILTPAQMAVKTVLGNTGRYGQGASWPLTWPVPLRLGPNEAIQVKSRTLAGGIPADRTTFCQFRAVTVDNKAEDSATAAMLRDYIKASPAQMPYFLSMFSENARSIAFPATGALQRVTAKTIEVPEHLLVIGYAALFARGANNAEFDVPGTTCSPRWRLQSSNGYSFSQKEIDLACYAYATPNSFWQEFPTPFYLPKGCSLSASFSTLDAIVGEEERIDNYVIFRCVTV